MTLTPSQRAALRAKKAIANGNTNFKPRGETNKTAFEALKKQAQSNIVSAESPPQKRMKITGGSSHTSDLASLLDIHPNTNSDTLDEEEDDAPSSPDIDSKHVEVETQPKTESCIAGKRSGNKEDDARIADEKWKTHSEKIKKREEQIEKKTYKPPSIPWGVQLNPKTEKEEEEERNEEMKKERNRRSMQIFKLANQVKQMDVLHKYKEFDTEENLLNWLLDVLEQKEEGFDIEDDDTREIAWQREKEDRTRKGLHTDMAEYKAKKLFFESNQFLLEPLQIKLLQKDLAGCLDTGEKYQLEQQVNYLKVKLKQEYHPNLINQRLGKQLQLLRNWDKNKDKFKELGVWQDDLTRELGMKQEAEFEKHTEEKIQKYVKQLKDGTLSLSACFKNSTVTVEEVQDSRPPSIPMICDGMVALPQIEDAEYDKDSEDDTDVEYDKEPPPCPVDMMNQN